MSQDKITCSNCDKPARIIRGNYHFKNSGLENVILCGIEIVKCDHCGNKDPMLHAMSKIFRTIALAVITKPYRLAGEEIRFLRRYLNMTGDKFSRLLHVDKTTLSKWENNDDPVGTQSDLIIRMLVMAQDENLKNRITDVVNHNFEKIKFRVERKGKNRKYIPQRATIEVNADDLSYAYA